MNIFNFKIAIIFTGFIFLLLLNQQIKKNNCYIIANERESTSRLVAHNNNRAMISFNSI